MTLTSPQLAAAPKAFARITGALYLAFILASVAADALGHIGLGTAQQMADSLTTSPVAFRLGLVMAFVSALMFVLAAWGLFVILRPVNVDLALLFLVLNTVGVAIQCASLLAVVSAMLGHDGAGASPVPPLQAQASILLALEVFRTGFVASQLFFGAWLFPLGYLVFASRLLPRFLGALLVLDGIAELVWFVQALVLPAYPAIRVPGTAVSLLAEVGLTLWLLIFGVRVNGSDAGPRHELVGAGSGGVR